MTWEPSPRQTDVLKFVATFTSAYGFAPSVRDIAAYFELASTNTIAGHLSALKKKGYVDSVPKQARTLRLTRRGTKFVEAMSGVRS